MDIITLHNLPLISSGLMHLHKAGFRRAYKWTDLQLRASKQAVAVLIKIVCFTFVVFRLQNIIKMILIEFTA